MPQVAAFVDRTGQPKDALHTFMRALSGWDAALKQALTRLVSGWVQATLAPLVHLLGPECPILDEALAWLAAVHE